MSGLVEQWADVLARVPRMGDLLGLAVSILPVVVATLATFLLPPLLTPPRPATAAPPVRRDRFAWRVAGVIVLFLATAAVTMAVIHVRAVDSLHAEGVSMPRRWKQQSLPGYSAPFALGAAVLWWNGRPRREGTTTDRTIDREKHP